jgi:Uma2 family endonuclease
MKTKTADASFALSEPALPNPPPLSNGDRLTRAEFERRYSATRNVKAELIEGVVYMPSPVRADQHGVPHVILSTWLGTYWASTPGVVAADNSTLRLDLDNEPQPDLLLRIERECGGATFVDRDGYVVGGPEFICEVAASSVSYDLHDKLRVYQRNGVREYLALRVLDSAVDWFVLRDDHYERLLLHGDGLLRSETFPGLWLDPASLLRGDISTVLHRLQEGLDDPTHAAFVQSLRERGARSSSG